MRNEPNFGVFRLGRIGYGWGWFEVGLLVTAESLAALEFGEVAEVGALGIGDVAVEAVEGIGVGGEAVTEIGALSGFVGDAGGVVDEVAGEEAVAAEEPIVLNEDIDEEALDDAEGLELVVVLGGEGGEGGGVFAGAAFVAGVDAGFGGIEAGDGFALGGARAGGELGVGAIGLDLFLGGHGASF